MKTSVFDEPFPHHPVTLDVQSIIYQNAPSSVWRAMESLDNSARIGKQDSMCERFTVALGDASPSPLFDQGELDRLGEEFSNIDEITYSFFNANTGTAKGHNRLAALGSAEFIAISNPDIIADGRALWRLASVFSDERVGVVEAKQLPIEHPKNYEPYTGRTSWASTAFCMTRRDLFDRVAGFDEKTFFMYCDDVDYSWLIRELGFDIVFQPAAIVFHDKRLTGEGGWIATEAERFFSAQAALLLAHKWSREDQVETNLASFGSSGFEEHRAAAAEFVARRSEGSLVAQHDQENTIATFKDNLYSEHRYVL